MKERITKKFIEFINEQENHKDTIKITDCSKIDSSFKLVSKYNKPIKAPKEYVDQEYNKLLEELKKESAIMFTDIEDTIIKEAGKNGSEKDEVKRYFKKFEKERNDIKTQVTEKIISMGKTNFYAMFGYGPELDYLKEISEIYNIIFNTFNKKLDTFVYRNLLNLMVTKKNVNRIIEIFDYVYNIYSKEIEHRIGIITDKEAYMATRRIGARLAKEGNVCKNIIITVDSSCNKLDPKEYWHPPLIMDTKDGMVNYEQKKS